MKKRYGVMIAVFFLFLIAFIFATVSNRTVAIVGNERIKRLEVIKEVKEQYFDQVLKEMINERLIDGEFEKLNQPITKEEKEEQLAYVQLADSNKNSLDDEATNRYVERYIKIFKLAKAKGIISDITLQNFLTEQKDEYGDRLITAKILYGSYDDMIVFDEKIKAGMSVESVAEEKGIEVEEEPLFSEYNEAGLDLSKCQKGETIIKMLDEDEWALVYIADIEAVDEEVFNLDENRKAIENVYFSKNYNFISAYVMNEIGTIYVIKE